MATPMLKHARTAAQKAATKKWQAAGAAKRKAHMATAARRSRGFTGNAARPVKKWHASAMKAAVRKGVFRNKQGIRVGYSRELRSWVSIPD